LRYPLDMLERELFSSAELLTALGENWESSC
jgi:hypothetical protein